MHFRIAEKTLKLLLVAGIGIVMLIGAALTYADQTAPYEHQVRVLRGAYTDAVESVHLHTREPSTSPLPVPLLEFKESHPKKRDSVPASYNGRHNRITTYKLSLSYPEQELWGMFLHELGHAWLSHATPELFQKYRLLIFGMPKIAKLSSPGATAIEGSPYWYADDILIRHAIGVWLSETEITKAVREDFAETLRFALERPEHLRDDFPHRFAFFCKNVLRDDHPGCQKQL